MRRRGFQRGDEAVSAVISTILMVAITVVLAATAFILVADIGNNNTKPPVAIGMRSDDTTDRIMVISSSQGADWANLAVRVVSNSGGGTIFLGSSAAGGYFNEAATLSGVDIASQTAVSTVPAPVSGADYMEFCRSGGTASPITVAVVDTRSGSLISEYSFLNLRPGTC